MARALEVKTKFKHYTACKAGQGLKRRRSKICLDMVIDDKILHLLVKKKTLENLLNFCMFFNEQDIVENKHER